MSKVTCDCGKCEFVETWSGPTWMYESSDWNYNNFCPECGDKLKADGTVESRAELEANLLSLLEEAELETVRLTDEISGASTSGYVASNTGNVVYPTLAALVAAIRGQEEHNG